MTYRVSIDGVEREATPKEAAELDAIKLEIFAEQEELAKTEYQRLRKLAYPPMADYLDGVVKNDQMQIQAYIDACLAVKNKYPKPSKNQ